MIVKKELTKDPKTLSMDLILKVLGGYLVKMTYRYY